MMRLTCPIRTIFIYGLGALALEEVPKMKARPASVRRRRAGTGTAVTDMAAPVVPLQRLSSKVGRIDREDTGKAVRPLSPNGLRSNARPTTNTLVGERGAGDEAGEPGGPDEDAGPDLADRRGLTEPVRDHPEQPRDRQDKRQVQQEDDCLRH